jgi:hypothetical protein
VNWNRPQALAKNSDEHKQEQQGDGGPAGLPGSWEEVVDPKAKAAESVPMQQVRGKQEQ